jgi:hypothetical protein
MEEGSGERLRRRASTAQQYPSLALPSPLAAPTRGLSRRPSRYPATPSLANATPSTSSDSIEAPVPDPERPKPSEDELRKLPSKRHRLFAVKLLRAFHKADVYSQERLGLRPRQMRRPRSSSSFTSVRDSPSLNPKERERRLLRRVHSTCVEETIDALCDLLGADEASEDRVSDALERASGGNGVSGVDVTPEQVYEMLEGLEENFSAISRSLSRSMSNRSWISDYTPDWKVKNVIWNLVQSLGRIGPPDDGDGAKRYRLAKEAVFVTMFRGDYLVRQRENCSFRKTLLRHVPQPGAWDADTGWLAIAFFVSIPLASTVHSFDNGHRLSAFWATFSIIFVTSSLFIVLGYAKYRSWYATRLLDSVAARVPEDAQISFGYTDPTEPATPAVVAEADKDTSQTTSEPENSAVHLEFDEPTEPSEDDSMLRLYQASMLVESLYRSYYFDDSVLLGLSEDQVMAAIEVILSTDSALGKQFAGFSFTAVALASRGASLGSTGLTPGALFSFGLFGVLASGGLICGLTSSYLSDLILRQLSLTQTKEDGNGHHFAAQFGSFIRLNGGLNGFAGECVPATLPFSKALSKDY